MLLLPLALLPPTFQPRQRLRNLLALLLHQVLLHRIIVIMLPQQFLQLEFLFDHRPSLLLALLFALLAHRSTLQPPLPLLFFLAVFPLISRMVHLQHPPHHARTAEVIHREVRRALIFVFQKRKAFALPGLFVADEIDIGRFPELGEDGQDVAFGQVEGEAAYVDVGCVSAPD